jgi:cytochrome c-type biogenesis protein CcmH/NrfG
VASAERLLHQLALEHGTEPQDPEDWVPGAFLALLWGRYENAVQSFDQARRRLADTPRAEAAVCGWQALAAYLDDDPEHARQILREGLALDPAAEMLRARLAVIPGESRP